MNKAQTELVAEILVEMSYAKRENPDLPASFIRVKDEFSKDSATGYRSAKVDITSDTLEARRQLDVVEDYFENECLEGDDLKLDMYDIWMQSAKEIACDTNHRWRKDRILWCLEQLTGDK